MRKLLGLVSICAFCLVGCQEKNVTDTLTNEEAKQIAIDFINTNFDEELAETLVTREPFRCDLVTDDKNKEYIIVEWDDGTQIWVDTQTKQVETFEDYYRELYGN